MFNVKDYGAIGDGVALDSPAIQRAIDECNASGGGVVYIPSGRYLCATMHLKSCVHIMLEIGAVILGSKNHLDFDDYETDASNVEFQDRSHSYFHHSLFHADGAERIAITGFGKIDMQSAWEDLDFHEFGGKSGVRWCRGCKAIAFKECTNVTIKDISIRCVTDLAVYVAGCENVIISGLDIFSHVDGISPDSCKNVVISDCIVDTGDDAIVPKSSYTLGRFKSMENLTITGCTVRSSASAIKFGTESNTAFINITVTGCTVYDTGIEGISLISTDGALIQGVSISNITMRNVAVPIMILLGNRNRAPKGTEIGKIQNVAISNVIITGPYPDTFLQTMAQNSRDYYANNMVKNPVRLPIIINGQPDSRIKNVSLSNIQYVAPGGGTLADRENEMKNVREDYPMAPSFANRAPVYGLFARNVDNLRLYNVDFSCEKEDLRDAVLLDDVTGFKEV